MNYAHNTDQLIPTIYCQLFLRLIIVLCFNGFSTVSLDNIRVNSGGGVDLNDPLAMKEIDLVTWKMT